MNTSPGVIVVGVDGSPSSKVALEWAAHQARLTGSKLRAIMTWEIPSLALLSPLPDDLNLQQDTEQSLRELVEEVLGDGERVEVEEGVTEGSPAQVLIDQSNGAELLVIGSRGRGGFAGLLLGSVSQHCVAHAKCPVVVTRAHDSAHGTEQR